VIQQREGRQGSKDQRNDPVASHISNLFQWVKVLVLVYFLLVAVGVISDGFKWASGGEEAAGSLFSFADNPFMALLMGALATALVQSSSTVSSVIVALVAAGLPVSTAIPMVMGANFGTTVTNTIVSLGHAGHSSEFRRAFAAATIHDFFNLLSVVIFLPLELVFGFMEKASAFLVRFFVMEGSTGLTGLNFIGALTKPLVTAIGPDGILGLFLTDLFGGIAMIILGILLIFLSISRIGKMLKVLMTGRAQRILEKTLARGPVASILAGTIITVLFQSSSTTTSLIVPFAGSGILTLEQVYPFTIGANIGTCITALMAATAVTGSMAGPALQIALVHLIYNVSGAAVIFGFLFLRQLPVICSRWLAELAAKNKLAAIGYMVSVFFLVPLTFVAVSSLLSEEGAKEVLPGVTETELHQAENQAEDLAEDLPVLAFE
jgi:sodium-dependent phosphate cotransporter